MIRIYEKMKKINKIHAINNKKAYSSPHLSVFGSFTDLTKETCSNPGKFASSSDGSSCLKKDPRG